MQAVKIRAGFVTELSKFRKVVRLRNGRVVAVILYFHKRIFVKNHVFPPHPVRCLHVTSDVERLH